jgi:hypothetical protein
VKNFIARFKKVHGTLAFHEFANSRQKILKSLFDVMASSNELILTQDAFQTSRKSVLNKMDGSRISNLLLSSKFYKTASLVLTIAALLFVAFSWYTAAWFFLALFIGFLVFNTMADQKLLIMDNEQLERYYNDLETPLTDEQIFEFIENIGKHKTQKLDYIREVKKAGRPLLVVDAEIMDFLFEDNPEEKMTENFEEAEVLLKKISEVFEEGQ